MTEKAMAPHSSTLAWKIPWTEDLNNPVEKTLKLLKFLLYRKLRVREVEALARVTRP